MNVLGEQLENTDPSSLLGPREEASASAQFGSADGCAEAASSPVDTSHLDGFDIWGMGEGAEVDTVMELNSEVWCDLYPGGVSPGILVLAGPAVGNLFSPTR